MSGAVAALVGFASGGRPTNFGGTLEVSNSGSATAGVVLNINGQVVPTTVGTVDTDTITGDKWFSPLQNEIGLSYWAQATVVTGETPSGSSLDVWVQWDIQNYPAWEVSKSEDGTASSTLLIQIGSGSFPFISAVASGTVILTATVTGGGGGGGGGGLL